MKNNYRTFNDITVIALNRGFTTTISTDDIPLIKHIKWSVQESKPGSRKFYVQGYNPATKRAVTLHRFLLGNNLNNLVCDHIDGDSLNNRRTNLRAVTHQQNQFNMKARVGEFVGVAARVSKKTGATTYVAYISKNGVRKHLGSFSDILSAAEARDSAALALFGVYARLNVLQHCPVTMALYKQLWAQRAARPAHIQQYLTLLHQMPIAA